MLGWALLRCVPLGRAIVVTAIGTFIGAVVGEFLNPFNPYAHTIPGVIGGALLGFVISRVRTADRDSARGIKLSRARRITGAAEPEGYTATPSRQRPTALMIKEV